MLFDSEDYSGLKTPKCKGGDIKSIRRRAMRRKSGIDPFYKFGTSKDPYLIDVDFYEPTPSYISQDQALNMCSSSESISDCCSIISESSKSNYDHFISSSRKKQKDTYTWNLESFS